MNSDTRCVRIAVDGRTLAPEPFDVNVRNGRLFLTLGVNASMDRVVAIHRRNQQKHDLHRGLAEDVGEVRSPEGFAKATPEQVSRLLENTFDFTCPPVSRGTKYVDGRWTIQ